MKLLLDENLPKRLKKDFPTHSVHTVREMGWNGIKNGQLLKHMLENDFQVLITFDKNLGFQQNFEKYPIPVLVLTALNNTYPELTKLSETVNRKLEGALTPGAIAIRSSASI